MTARIREAVRNINAAQRQLGLADEKFKDDGMKDLILGLRLLAYGLEVAMEAMPERIERLHQKIDRIEKKIGSV